MAGKKLIKKSTAIMLAKEMGKTFVRKKDLEALTATDDEVDKALDDIFGAAGGPPGERPDNTATDEEVDKILDDIFG